MRQIKFRCWDKEEERFDSILAGNILSAIHGSGDPLSDSEIERYVLQQFTGLKDRNGKEIYEGDIVKYSRCKIESYTDQSRMIVSKLVELGEYIGEILYFHPSFCWSYDYKRYDDIEELTGASHRYEIIGNIFENPELLKQ